MPPPVVSTTHRRMSALTVAHKAAAVPLNPYSGALICPSPSVTMKAYLSLTLEHMFDIIDTLALRPCIHQRGSISLPLTTRSPSS